MTRGRLILAIVAVAIAEHAWLEPCVAAEITITGNIRCQFNAEQQQGMECMVVYPEGHEDRATITESGDGAYTIKVPFNDFIDVSRTLYLVNDSVPFSHIKFTITRDELLPGNRFIPRAYKYKTWSCSDYPTNCAIASEAVAALSASYHPKPSTGFLASATGWLTNAVATLASLGQEDAEVVASAPESPKFSASLCTTNPTGCRDFPRGLQPGKLYERLSVEFAPMPGFGVSPSRNMDNAVFWNPSAIVLMPFRQISLQSNYQGFVSTGLNLPLSGGAALSAGFSRIYQTDLRPVYVDAVRIRDKSEIEEWVATASFAVTLHSRFSIAVAPKLLYQRTNGAANIDSGIDFEDSDNLARLVKEDRISRDYDFDVSATWMPMRYLALGANAMNLREPLGLLDESADKFANETRLRTLSVGATVYYGRLHLGGSGRFVKNDTPEFSAGANFVLLNHVMIVAGLGTEHEVRAAGFEVFGLEYSYRRHNERGNYHSFSTRLKF